MSNIRKKLSMRLEGKPRYERIRTFLATLGEVCRDNGIKPPIVVGGGALEIYTRSQYMSGDLDIKGNLIFLQSLLLDAGFEKTGERSIFWSEEFQILIDWQGASLEEGPEAEKRVLTLETEDGPVSLISVTDLIIDRLNAAKWAKDATSEEWAEVLLRLAHQQKLPVDWDVLKSAAIRDDCDDLLTQLLETIGHA